MKTAAKATKATKKQGASKAKAAPTVAEKSRAVADAPLPPPPAPKGLPRGSRVGAPSWYVWGAGAPHAESLATDPAGHLWVCRYYKARAEWGTWRRV